MRTNSLLVAQFGTSENKQLFNKQFHRTPVLRRSVMCFKLVSLDKLRPKNEFDLRIFFVKSTLNINSPQNKK